MNVMENILNKANNNEKIRDRIILHCDLNNFYASVECLLNPELRSVPVAVAGAVELRHGIILAKNEIAKKLGVKTAETIWQAKQKAPDLKLVPPQFEVYSKYSKLAFEIYTRFTSQVEPFGPDECWLDVTGSTMLFGSGKEIADKIRETIKLETGLTVSVGVSFNKFFAKMGSDFKKPDGTTVIDRQNFKRLLYHLPAREMFMIGEKTAEKLKRLNINTIGDIAASSPELLSKYFGINGIKLYENALGENNEEVRQSHLSRVEKSVGHGLTAAKDLLTYGEAETLLTYLSERVASRLRKKGFKAAGVAIDIKSNNLQCVARQKKIFPASFTSQDISKTAIELLRENWKCEFALRALTVTAFDLTETEKAVQTTMFDTAVNKSEFLEKALDGIKAKYGDKSITRASLIGTDYIYDKTEDEDFLPFKR